MLQVEQIFSWSSWQPLNGCWRGSLIPNLPGLYRIRRVNRDDLDYIGQTGEGTMTLKKRLGMLRGVYEEEMPYRDPHTAAPALWALRHSSNCEFEVSVLPVQGTTSWRKGLEALAISLYRQKYSQSPTVNFGRMPVGYRMSTSNNSKLVQAGKRFRGGLISELEQSHLPGISPLGELQKDLQTNHWCGHQWSDWIPLTLAGLTSLANNSLGLYRIRSSNQLELLYIGQGIIKARLANHLGKAQNPKTEQEQVFANARVLECSWVINNSWVPHQRLELENDLIAAHLLFMETVPNAQFLG
ncbi:GIY-YIG nuclease family protein [Calothrix sp. FACHB-156]|nr:GIY-YIG nuclease family protein [Calothrix sp. FACHB-156]